MCGYMAQYSLIRFGNRIYFILDFSDKLEAQTSWSFDVTPVFTMLEARTPSSFDLSPPSYRGTVLRFRQNKLPARAQIYKSSHLIYLPFEGYKKGVFEMLPKHQQLYHTCLTSHPSLPDNVELEPKGQTRERCLRPEIRSKTLVGSSNRRDRRSPHQS
jgi:hypothetical protein